MDSSQASAVGGLYPLLGDQQVAAAQAWQPRLYKGLWTKPDRVERISEEGWIVEQYSDAATKKTNDMIDDATRWYLKSGYKATVDTIVRYSVGIFLALASTWAFGLGLLVGSICGSCSPDNIYNTMSVRIADLWALTIPPEMKVVIGVAAAVCPAPFSFAAGFALGSTKIGSYISISTLRAYMDSRAKTLTSASGSQKAIEPVPGQGGEGQGEESPIAGKSKKA